MQKNDSMCFFLCSSKPDDDVEDEVLQIPERCCQRGMSILLLILFFFNKCRSLLI